MYLISHVFRNSIGRTEKAETVKEALSIAKLFLADRVSEITPEMEECLEENYEYIDDNWGICVTMLN